MTKIRGFYSDDETGEIVFYEINEETGEPALESGPPPTLLSPRNNISGQVSPPEPAKKYTKFPTGITTKTKQFQSLKAKIMDGSNTVSYRLLLIPTLVMICPGLLSVCLSILEIFLHVRCHKKNKYMKDPRLYFRSPFHAVTSTFCGVCRECDSALRVGQLQDERRYRYDYLRGIAL